MEFDKSGGQYPIKGGKTIIGTIFAYQERTGMSIKEILKLPYVMFIIGMIDAPSIDYKKGKKREEIIEAKTADQQINAVLGALR